VGAGELVLRGVVLESVVEGAWMASPVWDDGTSDLGA
jgi:hypothetical protein